METENYNIYFDGLDSTSISAENTVENTTTEIVFDSSYFQYLIQVEKCNLGVNLTLLLFFFIYCFCTCIHLMFKNF